MAVIPAHRFGRKNNQLRFSCSEVVNIFSDLNHDNLMRWSDGSNIIYEEWDGDVTSQLQPNVDDCAWLYVGKSKLTSTVFV